MKKFILGAMIGLSLSLLDFSSAFAADTKTFTLSASIPAATTVGINAFSVNASTNVFTAVTGTSLSFNPMTLDSINKIYLPDHYFAIDVAPSNGAGQANVTFTYTEGANPNSTIGRHGLGWKSTATFIKVVGTTETGITTHGPKKMLKDLSGENILSSEVSGGFLRVYVGIVAKDPTAVFPDPATSEVFSNADKAGSYDGTLLISATLV